MLLQSKVTTHTGRTGPHRHSFAAAARPPAHLIHRQPLISCRSSSSSSDSSGVASDAAAAPSTPTPSPAPAAATPVTASSSGSGKGGLAGGAVAAGVALFLATRLLGGGPSLAALEQSAVPLDVALSNGRPTVVEFYANWCEVCRELVPAEVEVEEQYKDKVNFVMLNIENTKWAPEMQEFGVNGIPHFVFIDGAGQPLAAAVGRLPREVLQGNVAALADGQQQLPYAAVRGQTSSIDPPTDLGGSSSSRLAGPRDHA